MTPSETAEAPVEEPRCRCLFRWSDHLMFTRPVEVVPGCPDHKPEDAQ